MAWIALALFVLFLVLGACTIHFGGNARAPDEQRRALLLALGSATALSAAVVLSLLAVFA